MMATISGLSKLESDGSTGTVDALSLVTSDAGSANHISCNDLTCSDSAAVVPDIPASVEVLTVISY